MVEYPLSIRRVSCPICSHMMRGQSRSRRPECSRKNPYDVYYRCGNSTVHATPVWVRKSSYLNPRYKNCRWVPIRRYYDGVILAPRKLSSGYTKVVDKKTQMSWITIPPTS